jgi:hypothetical protein
MSKLKEFKTLILEKTIPKSIKMLNNTILVLISLLVILVSIDLS